MLDIERLRLTNDDIWTGGPLPPYQKVATMQITKVLQGIHRWLTLKYGKETTAQEDSLLYSLITELEEVLRK